MIPQTELQLLLLTPTSHDDGDDNFQTVKQCNTIRNLEEVCLVAQLGRNGPLFRQYLTTKNSEQSPLFTHSFLDSHNERAKTYLQCLPTNELVRP